MPIKEDVDNVNLTKFQQSHNTFTLGLQINMMVTVFLKLTKYHKLLEEVLKDAFNVPNTKAETLKEFVPNLHAVIPYIMSCRMGLNRDNASPALTNSFQTAKEKHVNDVRIILLHILSIIQKQLVLNQHASMILLNMLMLMDNAMIVLITKDQTKTGQDVSQWIVRS